MLKAGIDWLSRHEGIAFALTNRIPRRLATRLFAWFSRIEHPLVRDMSLAIWQQCAGDLELHEARQRTFRSVHDCFVRQLKPGARPIDATPGTLVSPCDGIVVARGAIDGTTLIQAKGIAYQLEQLLDDPVLVERFRNGSYVTLRMHGACTIGFTLRPDGEVDSVTFVPGDTWNVNPAALERVERLYCRNTRAIVPIQLAGSAESLTLVPVGAILVASIQLLFLPEALDMGYCGPRRIRAAPSSRRGTRLATSATVRPSWRWRRRVSSWVSRPWREHACVSVCRCGGIVRRLGNTPIASPTTQPTAALRRSCDARSPKSGALRGACCRGFRGRLAVGVPAPSEVAQT